MKQIKNIVNIIFLFKYMVGEMNISRQIILFDQSVENFACLKGTVHLTNQPQFSIVYNLIDHRNDIKNIHNLKVKP